MASLSVLSYDLKPHSSNEQSSYQVQVQVPMPSRQSSESFTLSPLVISPKTTPPPPPPPPPSPVQLPYA